MAIFIVVSHNYWRNVLPAIGENEMLFSEQHVSNAINALMMRPSEFFNPFFSLFGHYGVHLFIFLSAYGLTKKLSNILVYRGGALVSGFVVSGDALIKTIKLSIAGFVVILLARYLQGIPYNWDILFQYASVLTFTNNLRPGHLYDFSTVWWYLAIAVQFYALFPFLYCATKKNYRLTFIISFLLLILSGLFNNIVFERYNVYLFATPLPHLVLFVLGIYLALGGQLCRLFLLPSLIVFFVGNFVEYLFPFTFISFVICVICVLNYVKNERLSKKLNFLLT